MLSVAMLSVAMLSVAMMSVAMISVAMLSVVAPDIVEEKCFIRFFREQKSKRKDCLTQSNERLKLSLDSEENIGWRETERERERETERVRDR